MIRYYKRTLSKLFADLQLVRAQPLESYILCLKIQEILIQKITYFEKKVRKHKAQVSDCTKLLKEKRSPPLTKDEAKILKTKIEHSRYLIDEYQKLQRVFRSVGDGLAFIYLDTWDIKPMAFKQSAGALSGKEGAKLERSYLRRIIKLGRIAILTDLTNCLRYGDIVVLKKDGSLILAEIKSGRTENARVRRQTTNAEKIIKYLSTDSINGLYSNKFDMKRIEAHSQAKYHTDKLNKVIDEALAKGYSGLEIENGLYYYADLASGPLRINEVCAKCNPGTIICFLNEEKYSNTAYMPFTLSIENPNALFRFYAGELMLLVLIDPSVIIDNLSSEGFSVELEEEGDYALTIRNSSEKEKYPALVKVSRHMFGRIPCEFLSLRWFLEELVYKITTPKEDAIYHKSHP